MLDVVVVFLARVLGVGSLVLFLIGPRGFLDLHLEEGAALAWDGALSLAFFLQHSVMVRRSVKARLARHIPVRYLGAFYAIAAGFVLSATLLLWQRTGARILSVGGPARWAGLVPAGLALVGFWWGISSLRQFDPFGIHAIRSSGSNRAEHAPVLTIRGPYRWVRHPLYFFTLVVIWSGLDVTLDRLLFNILWTAWIVVGTIFEERDLVAEMGAPYLAYQRLVPMLLPWRRPIKESEGVSERLPAAANTIPEWSPAEPWRVPRLRAAADMPASPRGRSGRRSARWSQRPRASPH